MSTHKLKAQKRMAMELMKVGRRGVWLDPERAEDLAKAKTRQAIRELIESGVIRRTEPRHRQPFVIAPQYWTRYRQRLMCDVSIRGKPRTAKPKPTSGKKFFEPQYWMRKKPQVDPEMDAAAAAAAAAATGKPIVPTSAPQKKD